MKIAILYICTGRYNKFFKGFYESCEKYFLKNVANIEYIVFTDDNSISDSPKVHIYHKECQGFPMDSLMRFDMFLSVKDELTKYDYCFFFNANMLFVDYVGEEFLPNESGLMAVTHPGYYNKPAFLYPYERRVKSTAYIPPFKDEYRYYMGSLNGGKTSDYLKLIKTCSDNIHKDLDNGIIAIFHDESQLNKYLSEHTCSTVSPAYAFPEGANLPFAPKIVIRDKTKVDPYFNKGRNRTLYGRIKQAFYISIRGVCWFLKISTNPEIK